MTNWVGIPELCLHLGISKETVYRMIRAETIPFYRVGKLYRFDLDEIDKMVKDGLF